MSPNLKGWMVVALLLATMAYALAEEITLTTYYPSPRGMYDELRTKGDVAIGTLDPPNARLEIRGKTAGTADKALYVGNLDGAPRLVVQNDGNVGIGTTSPAARLHVNGGDIQADAGIRLGGVTKSTWPSLACQTVSGTPNLYTSSATCPAGFLLTGGGCDITVDSGALTQNDDAPTGNTYQCNTGSQNSVVQAFAFCCQLQ